MPLPDSNSLNSMIISSDSVRAERSILFVICTWTFPHWLKNVEMCWKHSNMMYCNHMLGVGIIKLSLFTHSLAYFRHLCKRYASAHTRTGEKSLNNPTYAALHWLQSPISLSFPFARLSDEIEVAMPWLYAADTRTSVSPWGDAI